MHTNGVVSRQYLEVCGRSSCQLPADVSLGQALPLAREYFEAAYECLFEIGVKLGQVLWRKVQPAEIEKADENLITVTYNLISEGRYQQARVLLDFATGILPRHSKEFHRLTMVVNRAQTYKWTGDEAECKEILDSEDWSATSLRFQLAHAVLRNDFRKASKVMRLMGKNGEDLDKHAFREWPLFKELRKSPEFACLFEEIFGEPLNRIVVEDS